MLELILLFQEVFNCSKFLAVLESLIWLYWQKFRKTVYTTLQKLCLRDMPDKRCGWWCRIMIKCLVLTAQYSFQSCFMFFFILSFLLSQQQWIFLFWTNIPSTIGSRACTHSDVLQKRSVFEQQWWWSLCF